MTKIAYNTSGYGLALTDHAKELGQAISANPSWGRFDDEDTAIASGFRHDPTLIKVIEIMGGFESPGIIEIINISDDRYSIEVGQQSEYVRLPSGEDDWVLLNPAKNVSKDDPHFYATDTVFGSSIRLTKAAVLAGRALSGDPSWFCDEALSNNNVRKDGFSTSDRTLIRVISILDRVANPSGYDVVIRAKKGDLGMDGTQ